MEKILFCFNRFKALQIEITIFISSILGIIFSIFGYCYIPFEIDSIYHKIIFSINFPLLFLIGLISSIFIFFRLKYMINDKYNLFFYFLSLGLVIICMIELILNIINDSLIINNMYYNDYFSKIKKYKKFQKLSKNKWIISIIIMIILIINFFSLILLSLSQNLRIHLQIDGSFHNYLLAIKLEEKMAQNKTMENNSGFSSDININIDEIIKNKKGKKNKTMQIDFKNYKDNNMEIIIDNNKMNNGLVKNEQK